MSRVAAAVRLGLNSVNFSILQAENARFLKCTRMSFTISDVDCALGYKGARQSQKRP